MGKGHRSYKTFQAMLLAFALTVLGNEVLAQGLTYSIGFAGNLTMNTAVVPTNTNPFQMKEQGKCLLIDNGISKFIKSGTQTFSLSCVAERAFEILLYPNPSTRNYVIVTVNSAVNSTGGFQVKLLDFDGKVRVSVPTTLAALKSGVRVSLPQMAKGIYLINVQSENDGLSATQKIIIVN